MRNINNNAIKILVIVIVINTIIVFAFTMNKNFCRETTIDKSKKKYCN